MAIEVISGYQTSNANDGGNVTITFSVAPSEGDYSIMIVGTYNAVGEIPAMVTTGYTRLSYYKGSVGHPAYAIFYKKQGATPDTNAVGKSMNGTTTDSSMVGFVLRGVDPDTFSDATPTTAGPTTSTNPAPSAITLATAGACVVVVSGMAAVQDLDAAAPTGYTGWPRPGSDTYSHTIAAAYKLGCTGTETPATWTNWSNGLWHSTTFAVRPIPDEGANFIPKVIMF